MKDARHADLRGPSIKQPKESQLNEDRISSDSAERNLEVPPLFNFHPHTKTDSKVDGSELVSVQSQSEKVFKRSELQFEELNMGKLNGEESDDPL